MTKRRTDRPLAELPEHLREKEQHWRELIDGCSRSGQSVASYCKQNKICANSFYQWRTELARRDKARGSGAQERALTFVPLTVDVPAVQRGELEVVLIGDRRIRIVDDFEPAILAKLVTVLEQLPC